MNSHRHGIVSTANEANIGVMDGNGNSLDGKSLVLAQPRER
jgi:hypothetical protein